jgi:hypothetical protein
MKGDQVKRIIALGVALSLIALALPPRTTRAEQSSSQIIWDNIICQGDYMVYVQEGYTEVRVPGVGTLWAMDRLYADGTHEHLWDGFTAEAGAATSDLYPQGSDPVCDACIQAENKAARELFEQKKDFFAGMMPVSVGLCGFTGPGFWACVATAYLNLGAAIYTEYLSYQDHLRQIPYRCISSSGRPCKSY